MASRHFPTLDRIPPGAQLTFAPHVAPADLPPNSHIVVLPPYLSIVTLTGAAADTLSHDDRVALLSCLAAHRETPALRLLHSLLALVDVSEMHADIFRATLLQFMRVWSRNVSSQLERSVDLLIALVKTLEQLANMLSQRAALRLLLRQLDEAFDYAEAYQDIARGSVMYFAALDVHVAEALSSNSAHIQRRLHELGDADFAQRQAWVGLSALSPASLLLDPYDLEQLAADMSRRASEPVIARGLSLACGLHLADVLPERAAAIRYVLLGALRLVCVLDTGHPELRAYAAALHALTEQTPLELPYSSFAKALKARSHRRLENNLASSI